MTMSLLLAGVGLTIGVIGVLVASLATSSPGPTGGAAPAQGVGTTAASGDMPSSQQEQGLRRRAVAGVSALAAAAVTAALTRWPVAAGLAGVAAAGLPALLRSVSGRSGTERIEAVAAWTEMLRDTLAAAAGLGQAIVATADMAPSAIRPSVTRLADRLSSGMPMETALRAFAAEMGDASADLVVCALLVASSVQSQRLAELLGALADSCRDEVALRLRVEASRASARSSVRTVVLVSLAFAVLLFVFAHSYLSPFGTSTGQLVLGAVGSCYAAGIVLMVRMVRPRPAIRLLSGDAVQ